jgi:hypothetical protein
MSAWGLALMLQVVLTISPLSTVVMVVTCRCLHHYCLKAPPQDSLSHKSVEA